MSNEVQFDTDNNQQSFRSRVILGNPTTPKMINLILKTGIVKTERQAGITLLFIAICSLLASLVIFYFAFFPSTKKLTPEQEQQRQEFLERMNKIQSNQKK